MRSAVLNLITALLGIWLSLSIDDIFMERMSGAMTNAVFAVNVHYGAIERLASNEPTKMLLRIYGQGIDWMFSRRRELECTQRLAEAGIAPKWLGTFGNGRFEEFVRNLPITSEMIREPELSGLIARKLFHLHYKADYEGDQEEAELDMTQKSVLWKRLKAWRAKAIEALDVMSDASHPQNGSPYLQKILQLGLTEPEFDEALRAQKEECKSISSPIVLCHNDLHQGNAMLREEDRSLILIDFEYAALSPRGFDIANHFCEWAADYTAQPAQLLDFVHRFPSFDQQMNFIRAYCEEASMNDVQVEPEMLYLEAQAYLPISHVLWAHWGIIQASKSYIDFDYLHFSYKRLDQYLKTRTV